MICLKDFLGGVLVIDKDCPQPWIDANLRILPEDPPGTLGGHAPHTLDRAAHGWQPVDAIYWGGQYAREVWKVPNSCQVTITCDGEGGVSIETCTNFLCWALSYVWNPLWRLHVYPAGVPLPSNWNVPPNTPNNW